MAKFGLITIVSIVLNLFLSFWLINQYLSDVYFQAYVNATIGQYYPFIVLTLGIGGGSGLGYLFLKRKHGDSSLVAKIQKSKSFKPLGPLTSTSTTNSVKQNLPTGAPPAPVSKHTAYAVPPLPRSGSPSISRGGTGSNWAAAGSTKSSLESIISPKQDTAPKPGFDNLQTRNETSKPSSSPFTSFTETLPPQPLRSIGEASTKQVNWSPQQPLPSERRQESGPIFQKPGLEVGTKPDQQYAGLSSQPSNPQTAPTPSKWTPPEEKSGSNQWSEGGVRSIPPLPTKWSPPSGLGGAQDKPSAQQGFPRAGQGPSPTRGPVSTPQTGPRPFIVQGPGGPSRPGEQRPMGPPRPIAAPQPFRPDPTRPPPGVGGQPRSQPAPRPAAPLAGPMPQPWTPSTPAPERREYTGLGIGNTQPASATRTDASSSKEVSEPKSSTEGSGGGGEMDWDTALDTILKTLRKDRVGDTK
jgi:hypothetical protein